MEIEHEILSLVRIVTNIHRQIKERSPGSAAELDQKIMCYREVMSNAGLDPDDVRATDTINFFKLCVATLHIVDMMRENDELIPMEHINSILVVNELMFALMAAFCPAMLDAPAGYWGEDDYDDEGDDDETF